MTPKNREELIGMLTRGFATSGVAFWTDATTGELLDALDATGLAIVPKEPTDAMVAATCGPVVYHTPRNHYDRGCSQNTAPCSKHHRLGQNWMGQHPPSPCRHA
jgi:hypothetical protein